MSVRNWLRSLTGGRFRRTRLQDLKDAVESHLPVLPLVGAQLRDANRQIEQAVAQVSSNFGRMVEQAREGVNETSRLVGIGKEAEDGAETGIGSLLAASRTTLEGLMVRIVSDGEICGKLIERMDSLEKDMDRIVRALADVDRISFGHTILALNAKVEAAHIGERGQGFELVAQELWTQARRSEQITEEIRSTIVRLAGDAKVVQAEVGQMACADQGRLVELRRQVQESLDRLERTHDDMRASVAGAGERSEALAHEIAGAVETMQFQDRVSQRIVHMVEALESMQADLEARLAPLGRRPVSETGKSKGAEMLSVSYTMDGERSVHPAILGKQAAEEPVLNDVEIF